jgi:hypothetical protein
MKEKAENYGDLSQLNQESTDPPRFMPVSLAIQHWHEPCLVVCDTHEG